MRPQRLKVVSIPWKEDDSGQCSIELETSEGNRFTCFCEQSDVQPGQYMDVETFYWLNGDDDLDQILQSNPDQIKGIERLAEWDYFLRGEIVDIEDRNAIVDCGGVLIPLENFGADRTAIGAWVGFRVERLEVEPVE